MISVVLRSGLVAIALCAAAPALAQGQFGARSSSSRHAEDRRADESARQTQSARQTEAPKPEAQKPAESAPRAESKGTVTRQREPQRQHEPQRQGPSSQRNESGHWNDPGPAWRPVGPAWRDLNDRPNVARPGEDAFRASQGTYSPRDRDRLERDRRDRDSRRNGRDRRDREFYIVPYGIPVPYYDDVAPSPSSDIVFEPPLAEPRPEPRADDRPLGFLGLRVQPRNADVYVDGLLAGTVDDFGGRGARMLTAGPHRVELVAPGYQTVTFDVRVPENDTVTFTRDLEPGVDRPAPPPVVIPHKSTYVVPMCYIGDRPPLPGDMPAGCRVEDVRLIP